MDGYYLKDQVTVREAKRSTFLRGIQFIRSNLVFQKITSAVKRCCYLNGKLVVYLLGYKLARLLCLSLSLFYLLSSF